MYCIHSQSHLQTKGGRLFRRHPLACCEGGIPGTCYEAGSVSESVRWPATADLCTCLDCLASVRAMRATHRLQARAMLSWILSMWPKVPRGHYEVVALA